MTDSVKLCLNLRDMPEEARREVEVHHAQTKNKRNRNVGKRYPKKISTTSPMSGTGMKLETYWDEIGQEFLQSQIVADMNIPNALTGHNCEHGTSVFAAGVAALELLKCWMVSDGVPGSAVDMLTTHHVALHGATVTYLLRHTGESQAHASVLEMKAALRLMGYVPTGNDSTNETFYVHRNGYVITVYHKTNFSHCIFPNEEFAEILKARARCIVRIEIYMQGHYLRERGWGALESWRNAYAEGRYEAIFNELVRGLFKLDVVLRQKTPRKEALKNLTATERAIVKDYLAGTSVDALPAIKEGATADARSKIKSKWKMIIRDKLHIDITIPWEQHQKLHHADIERLVRYPGDYHPNAVTVAQCLCEETWPKLRQRLKKLRSDEVARQPPGRE
jgi:hypothetical protein